MREKRDKILELLNDLELITIIELLSNVMLAVSMNHLDLIKDTEQVPNNWNDCIQLLLKDKEANGETLANALGRQAVIMIMWLGNTTKEK